MQIFVQLLSDCAIIYLIKYKYSLESDGGRADDVREGKG